MTVGRTIQTHGPGARSADDVANLAGCWTPPEGARPRDRKTTGIDGCGRRFAFNDRRSIRIARRNHLEGMAFSRCGAGVFRSEARDLIIGGKSRVSYGKGLRAITHAAFTVGLLEYCRSQEAPHPGFVILDSPLLAYRAPEGQRTIYGAPILILNSMPTSRLKRADRQTIIVENDDPPESIKLLPQTTMFTGNPNSGRFGLFPPLTSSAANNSAS